MNRIYPYRNNSHKSQFSQRYGFTALLFFLMFSLFKPAGVEEISYLLPLNYLLTMGQFLLVPVTIWLYKDRKINLFIVVLLTLVVVLLFFSFLEGSIVFNTRLFNWLKILFGCLLLEACMKSNRIVFFFRAVFASCVLILLINLIFTFLINPGGMYSNFLEDLRGICFYGDKNSVRNPALLGFMAACALDYYAGCRAPLRSLFALFLGVFSVGMVGSATSFVALCVLSVAYLFVVLRNKILDIRLVGILIAAFWAMVVFVRKLPGVEQFVVGVLQRDMTFSGRTIIWDQVLANLSSNIFYGHGLNVQIPVGWNVGYVTHCHNAYLDITYRAGIIGLILFIALIVLSLRSVYYFISCNIAKSFALVLLAFLFVGIFGSLDNPFFFMVLGLCYNIREIIQNYEQ